MSRVELSPEDLSHLIGLVYQSAFEKRQWHSLICEIVRLAPGAGAAVFPFEDMELQPSGIATIDEFATFDRVVLDFESTRGENVLRSILRPEANGYVARSKKYFPPETWKNSAFYLQRLKPLGFEHCLNLVLGSTGRRGAMLSFATPDDDELYDRLFEILKLISPHAIRAQELSRALAIARRTTEVMGGFLDAIALPMLVTDAEAQFMFGNVAGRRLLERGRPFGTDARGGLVLDDDLDTAALRRRIADVDAEEAAAGLRIAGEDGDLLLCVTPFRPSMKDVGPVDRHLLSDARLFAVFVGQPASAGVSLALLRDTFDLTLREAEVCRDLLAGRSAGEIADASGRALKTVRNQIQTIHDKIGVATTPQLMESLSVFRTVGEMFETGAGRPVLPRI